LLRRICRWLSSSLRKTIYSLKRWPGFTPLPVRTLILISIRVWVNPRATVRREELGKVKLYDHIGSWTSDIQACSIVAQSTALPRVPSRSQSGWSTDAYHTYIVRLHCAVVTMHTTSFNMATPFYPESAVM
jgi:hypothetical protein